MGIMEEFRDAEAVWAEGLSVAQEIAGLGRDFLGRVKQHRDDLKGASEALLGGIGGVVVTMKAVTAPPEPSVPPVPAEPPATDAPPVGLMPDWSALQGQAASLPG